MSEVMEPIYGTVWRDQNDQETVMVIGMTEVHSEMSDRWVLILEPRNSMSGGYRGMEVGKVTRRSSSAHAWERLDDDPISLRLVRRSSASR